MNMDKDIEIARLLIKEILPQFIKIDDKTYQLYDKFIGINPPCEHLELSYIFWDGYNWNWDDRILDVYYQITNNLPTEEEYIEKVVDYNSSSNSLWMNPDYYHLQLNFNNCINNFKKRLNKLQYEIIDKVYTKEELFHKELTELLNKHCIENKSNTPDHILANYLVSCLNSFNYITNTREKWYGRTEENFEMMGEN